MQIIKSRSKEKSNSSVLIHKIFKYKVFESASTLSYYFLFSFFPFLMLMATSLSNFDIADESIYRYLSYLMPEKLSVTILNYIKELEKSDTPALLILSLVLTLYSMLKAVSILKEKIRTICGTTVKRNLFSDGMVNLLFVLLLIIAFYATLIIIVAGKKLFIFLLKLYGFEKYHIKLFSALRMFFTISIVLFLLYGIYFILPGEKYTRKEILPGTLFATAIWMISSYLFAYYVDNMNGFSLVYGSLGAIIILMTWLYLINIAILLGALLNSGLKNKELK